MRRFAVMISGSLVAAVLYAAPAAAQAGGGCGITQAADMAVQKQIALLDATKVDSSKYFNGADSCLGSNLLNSFDLSNLIPSSFNFLGDVGSNLIDKVISEASTKVCDIVNEQLQKIIGKINTQMFDFESLLGGQMSELLGGSGSSISQINIPGTPDFGQYQFTRGGQSGGTPPPTGPIVTPPLGDSGINAPNGGNPSGVNPASGGTGTPGLFEQLFEEGQG